MKALVEKIAFKSSLVQRLFSSGTLRRGGGGGAPPPPGGGGGGIEGVWDE
jgi:hypothetical protein